jgi:hypothetical protein
MGEKKRARKNGRRKKGEGLRPLFIALAFLLRPFFLTRHLFKNPKTFNKIKRLLRRLAKTQFRNL